jgi:hypothetical protein
MKPMYIPDRLKDEFVTVQAVWNSNGTTRRVDCLLLTWVKYEKQLRRLFCFLVFQHPKIDDKQIDAVIKTIAENPKLYPETFIRAINSLQVMTIQTLLGDQYSILWKQVDRIKVYRNKLMHGQITGQKVSSRQLERDINHLMSWMTALGNAADQVFGYDGIGRNTYRSAKSSTPNTVQEYPFSDVNEFKSWLNKIIKK